MSKQDARPIILVICNYYLPGFESGGAMRTLVNMVDRLGGDYDFRIITRDHDGAFDKTSYTNVTINDWNRVGNAHVYYLSRDHVGARWLRALILEISPSAIYLNSFFSPLTFSVLTLRRLKQIGPIPIILAPEGEFSSGALSLKQAKKRLYITAVKLLHLLVNIIWKAAAESEVADIHRALGNSGRIFVAPNMPPKVISSGYDPTNKPEKLVGRAEMVFLSRFVPKKNFNWLLKHLGEIKGELKIDICGPVEEADYWAETQTISKTLPPNIRIDSKGPVPHDQVAATLAKYHFFVLPTLGENFGHVFVEAFASGCPVIISDRTPWRDLNEKGIGWDLALEDPAAWVEVINICLNMNDEQYRKMSARSREFVVNWLSDPSIETSNRDVLQHAINSSEF